MPVVGLPDLRNYHYPDIIFNGPDVKISYHDGIAILQPMLVTDIKLVPSNGFYTISL